MRYSIGVDIGGTFTDFVAYDSQTFRMFSEKVLTTPDRPADGVIQGLQKLTMNNKFKLDQVGTTLHATTLATNAVIERKGARTGLLTTSGFEDVLDIRKGLRYNQYDLKIQLPKPYVPRYLRRGASERILASGEVYKELDEKSVLEGVRQLVNEGIESLAISFIHSYANSSHEKRAKEIASAEFPHLAISVSHEVTAQAREYERTSTVVVDAYIKPIIQTYLDDLSVRLEKLGFRGKLLIMTCSGGVVEIALAKKVPVLLLESGPVAGASISAEIAKKLNLRGIFSFDMGGTTAKGCIVRNWKVEKSYEFEVARIDEFGRGSGIPISIPTVKLIEIGSGGGSIARVDQLGIVRVGPESAGAKPGPACYGLGGKLPTVTDSDLMLGYLDENYFLGGSMKLYPDLAEKAIEQSICEKTNLSVQEAAWAIHERVNEDVATAFRLYASEIGVDYRKYSFISFGGAGPVHAIRIAKKLRTEMVVIPLRAGVLSAEGLLVSPLSIDLSQTKRNELSDLDYPSYRASFEDLIERGSSVLISAGAKKSDLRVTRKLDMCYHGQGYDITVDLFGKVAREEFSTLSRIFESTYKANYSVSGLSSSVDITAFKVTISVSPLKISLEALEEINGRLRSKKEMAKRAFDSESARYRKFKVVSRYSLRRDDSIHGPALIQEIESTTVLPSGRSVRVDRFNNLVASIVI